MTSPDPKMTVRSQLQAAKQAINGAKRDNQPHSLTMALTSLHAAVEALATIVIVEDASEVQAAPETSATDGARPRSVPRDPNEPNIGTMSF